MAHMPFHLPEKQAAFSTDTSPDAPPEGERWSTWDKATHGPKPRPPWVVTELAAVDADLGVLKTGKEADVHVVRRWVPGGEHVATMAAKRYRSGDHRLFHRQFERRGERYRQAIVPAIGQAVADFLGDITTAMQDWKQVDTRRETKDGIGMRRGRCHYRPGCKGSSLSKKKSPSPRGRA